MDNENVKINAKKSAGGARKGFWSIFLFYFFVAFEFAYMAGPFAVYFYSVYSPVLNFLNDVPVLSWLIKFFLPHVVRETSSPFLFAITVIGVMFSVIGFIIFVIGACQIYYSKLRKKGAVTGGLYKYIRHPQYTSFIVCSFGLMLLWPRYIVIIFFVTLVFGYYFLARAEEKECEAKFGKSFVDYEMNTGRFFPRIGAGKRASFTVRTKGGKLAKFLKVAGCYAASLMVTLGAAYGLNQITINSLYAHFTKDSATISLCKMDDNQITHITDIAKKNSKVKSYINNTNNNKYELNYIMPTEWFAAEVPMNGVKYRSGHKANSDYDRNKYKVIFLSADLIGEGCSNGKDILKRTQSIIPLVEVWVDLSTESVTDVKEMPDEVKYQGIPEAIY